MSTFAQTADCDLYLGYVPGAPGKLRLRLETDVAVCAAIKIRNRFRFYKGTWFADTRQGAPWLDLVFVKNPSTSVLRQIVSRIVLSVPGTGTLNSVGVLYDRDTRFADVSFEAQATNGRTITGGLGAPFIVDGKDISSPSVATQETAL